MPKAIYSRSALCLDWCEQEGTLDKRVWLCWSTKWHISVCDDGKTITAQVGKKEMSGFQSVYDAMKWAESVWITGGI